MKTFLRCGVLFGVLGLAAEALAQRPAPPPASQTEVNAGTDTYKYVTPAGLAGYSLLQSTSSISALTATNIAEYAAQTRDLAMSNILSTRLDGTNTALRAAWALADNVVSNALSARLIATNANLQPIDSDLTALAGLGDPGADRLLFWDDSASSMAYLTLGTGLTISGTTITASGGTGGTGMQNPATADFDVANYSLLNVDTIYGNDAAHGSDLSLHSYDSDASIKLYTFDSGSGIQYASQNGHTFTGPVTFNDGVTAASWSFTSVAATSVYSGATNAGALQTDADGKLVAATSIKSLWYYKSMHPKSAWTATDVATRFWGEYDDNTSVQTNAVWRVPFACTVTNLSVKVNVSGTLGSAENVAHQLLVNGGTVGLAVTNTWNLAGPRWFNVSGSLALAAGDVIVLQVLTPTFTTDPTGVRIDWTANGTTP